MRQPLILPQDALRGIDARIASAARMAANVSTRRGIPAVGFDGHFGGASHGGAR